MEKWIKTMCYCGVFAATLAIGLCSEAEEIKTTVDLDKLVAAKGTLVLEDSFDRLEEDNSQEQVGNGWKTNSQSRAKGTKQADLRGDSIMITMAKVADHAVSVKHDAPFDNGVVKARFQMHDSRGIGFNFNDPQCKVSHAGHICHVGVKPKLVDLRDGKTGIFDLKIREKKLGGASKEEIARLTKGKFANYPVDLEVGKWHEIAILIRGDQMSVWLNGKFIGDLKSPGIDHEVKQNIAFSVSGTAEVDQLQIWSLAP